MNAYLDAGNMGKLYDNGPNEASSRSLTHFLLFHSRALFRKVVREPYNWIYKYYHDYLFILFTAAHSSTYRTRGDEKIRVYRNRLDIG